MFAINAGVYFAEVLILYTYISDMFTRKYSEKRTILIGVLLFALPLLLNELWNSSIVNIVAYLLAAFLFFRLTYHISTVQSFLQSLISTGIMFGTELLCMYSISMLFDMNTFYAYRESSIVYILDAFVSKILYLLICKLISRYKVQTSGSHYKLPIAYFIYAFASVCLSLCMIIINAQYAFTRGMQAFILLSAGFLLFSLIFIFISFENSARRNAELAELKTERKVQQIDEKYYQIVRNQNDNMHMFAHDIKHHLSAIVNISDQPEVREYVHAIYADIEKHNTINLTHNKTLDILLSEYYSLCETKGIRFEIEVKTANLLFMESSKLACLLTNVLDNAVEAAELCADKYIFLTIKRAGNFEVLTCENSCAEKPKIVNNTLRTTKVDASLHGFGTKSIVKMVNFYHGTYQYKYDAEKHTFLLSIVFPTVEQEPAHNAEPPALHRAP